MLERVDTYRAFAIVKYNPELSTGIALTVNYLQCYTRIEK